MAKKKPQISLSSAEEVRDKITAKQTKQIQAMFTKLAKEAREKAKKLEGRDNISSIIQKKYLEDLAKELEHQLNADFVNLKKNLEQDMTQVSESVIDCVREFEESVGMPISNSWLNVPVDAVEAVQSGKLYAGNWTLSSRIWGMERKVMKDIHTVIAEGIAANKSAYDIAKDLEKYVNPKAKKDWNWSKVYPGTNRKVDYSAQRLARTMVSHAYQFSFVESTKDNPFIAKYKWISSHDKRVCPICKERDGKLFDKDKLPLDHPNGRCTFVSVFDKSATQISDEMAAWVKGKEGDFPKLDEYMKKKFGTDRYEKAMQMAMQGMKQETGKVDYDKVRKEAVQNAVLTNPKHGKSVWYSTNCQRCVPAWEYRQRGLDVTAMPSYDGDKLKLSPYSMWKVNLFDSDKTQRVQKDRDGNGFLKIKDFLIQCGDGSRVQIIVEWDVDDLFVDSGHVFCAQNIGGEILFLDPQVGKYGKEVEKYFDVVKNGSTSWLRIDNRDLNDANIKDVISGYGE